MAILEKYIFNLILLLSCFLMLNCAPGKPLAISIDSKNLNITEESIALLVIKTSNKVNAGFVPLIRSTEVRDNINNKNIKFDCANSVLESPEGYLDHLISMQLPPGDYTLTNFSGSSTIGGKASVWVPPGSFSWNFSAEFNLIPNKIVYLGRMEAINRDRIGNEKQSGSTIPLIPQSVSGFSRGTFDLKCIDMFEEDLNNILRSYQWVREYHIEKNILNLVDNGNSN